MQRALKQFSAMLYILFFMCLFDLIGYFVLLHFLQLQVLESKFIDDHDL